ncbi:hypothetical protein BH20ACT2_BH20ACT2_14130 [soil metagenome]
MRRRVASAVLIAALALAPACSGRDADDQTIGGEEGNGTSTSSTTRVTVPPGSGPRQDYLLTISVPTAQLEQILVTVAGGAEIVQRVDDERVVVNAPIDALPSLARLDGVERAEINR